MVKTLVELVALVADVPDQLLLSSVGRHLDRQVLEQQRVIIDVGDRLVGSRVARVIVRAIHQDHVLVLAEDIQALLLFVLDVELSPDLL